VNGVTIAGSSPVGFSRMVVVVSSWPDGSALGDDDGSPPRVLGSLEDRRGDPTRR
jgi:hypothetical protein